MRFSEITAAALRLPPQQRATLAARIRASLEENIAAETNAGGASRLRLSRLGVFLKSQGIPTLLLARESGYARRYLKDLCEGRAMPRAFDAAKLAAAVSRIMGRQIRPAELFDEFQKPRRVTRKRSQP